MSILEVRSVYQYLQDRRDNPSSLGAKTIRDSAVACGSEVPKDEMEACWYQIALEGSIFTDDGVPTFTYAGRQEMFGCYYDSQETFIKRIRNAIIAGSLTQILFWNSSISPVYTACTNDISIKESVQQLMIEFPDKVHVVPNYTNTITYLKHIGVTVALTPICAIQKQINGTGAIVDDFGGIITVNSYVTSDTINITIKTPWGESITQNVNSGITLKFTEPYTIYNVKIDEILNTATTRFVRFTPCYAKDVPTVCISEWICDEPRTGWETDGCGYSRYNVRCDPTVEIPVEYKPSDTGKVLLAGGALALALIMMNSNK